MNWQEVCADSSLQELAYKIELNEWGQIVMSPATNKHGSFQVKISIYLSQLLPDGELITECSIQTRKGVKVADVAWASDEFMETHGTYGGDKELQEAPEICVEILSPSNTPEQMEEKKTLYLDQGAKEFWLCEGNGNMNFYSTAGKLVNSQLVPDFPHHIKIKWQ
ncbi:MAG: Uma2 family endonuclease [SAR324 cluster bacterium]|nr:Uma2 family endonuclease [SAR324 cluster bacterium]